MRLHELLSEEKEHTKLPAEAYASVKREITDLAKDTTQDFANALAVVEQAYKHCDVEVPTPAMRDAWKHYEEFITHAVHELGKYQPDGEWRVTPKSSSVPPASSYY